MLKHFRRTSLISPVFVKEAIFGAVSKKGYHQCETNRSEPALARHSSKTLLRYIPESHVLYKSKKAVILDFFRDKDKLELLTIMKEIVDEGREYCQVRMEEKDFEGYFLSHDTFVVRCDDDSKEVIGGFFLKPNFCGRSSHVANTAFIVKAGHRGSGVGEYMARKALQIGKDLGYRSIMGNLVYANNKASLQLMKKIGFQVNEGLPKAGYMKGIGFVDAYQIFFDLKKL